MITPTNDWFCIVIEINLPTLTQVVGSQSCLVSFYRFFKQMN